MNKSKGILNVINAPLVSKTISQDCEFKPKRIPLYALVADEIKRQIALGVFLSGERLPSERTMALSRQVSINTVQEAYRQLEDEQWVVVKAQSGVYVASKLPTSTCAAVPAVGSAAMRYVADSGAASALMYRDDLIPFGAAVPHPSFFPCEKIAHGMVNLLRRKPSLIGSYNFAPGSLELRQQIARRGIEWGAIIDPRRVVITNGAVEAVQLCLRAVTSPGDTVVVETPTYYGFLQTLQMMGLNALEIPCLESEGFNVNALDNLAATRKIAAVLLSTTVGNPHGLTMPLSAKRRLVEVAVRHAIPVIEDATFADLHYDGECQAAQGFDSSGLFMLCSSLSKTIAPGMRLGWVDGGRYSECIAYLKRVSSIGQPQFLELSLAAYLAKGGVSKRLRSVRKAMRGQVEQMADNVLRMFPKGTSFLMPSGGFLLWVELPLGANALELQEKAVGLGVGIAPGTIFSSNGSFSNYIRLNCGVPDTLAAQEGLSALSLLVAQLSSRI